MGGKGSCQRSVRPCMTNSLHRVVQLSFVSRLNGILRGDRLEGLTNVSTASLFGSDVLTKKGFHENHWKSSHKHQVTSFKLAAVSISHLVGSSGTAKHRIKPKELGFSLSLSIGEHRDIIISCTSTLCKLTVKLLKCGAAVLRSYIYAVVQCHDSLQLFNSRIVRKKIPTSL